MIYFLLACVLFLAGCASSTNEKQQRIPMIYSTDLFHPPEDPDDHYDLAMLAGLDEIDVKAFIFDLSTAHRKPEEAGINALYQTSKITGQPPPSWKIGLRNPLRSPDDKALDQPEEFQGGVELILSTLEQSEEQLVMFLVGSCRDFVVAFNRNPELLKKKVKAVYVNAGNGITGDQTEWNVGLDPYAYVGLMSSGLPIYWCPCFTNVYMLSTPDEVTAGKAFCTYFLVPNQAEFLASTSTKVKNFFAYALTKSEEEPLSFLDREQQAIPGTPRNMWCTGPFLHAAGREIYQTKDGKWIARTPEKAKALGIEGPAVEVFHFEPVNVRYEMKNENEKLLPVFYEGDPAEKSSIQVFRYIHPDFNVIMASVLADLLETL